MMGDLNTTYGNASADRTMLMGTGNFPINAPLSSVDEDIIQLVRSLPNDTLLSGKTLYFRMY